MTKSIGFSATFGLTPGYFHNNEISDVNHFILIWKEEMMDAFMQTNICVTAVVHETVTVYPEDWGCPSMGEKTITVTGNSNPYFLNKPFDDFLYKETVLLVCQRVKERLNQKTVQVVFTELEHYYF